MAAKSLQNQGIKKKVLAVDDEEEILNLYKVFLAQQGFEVSVVTSAEETLSHLKEDVPDIILLDVNMPNIDGLLLLEMLRMSPETQNIPIIMISARRDGETITKAAALGCDNFIIKPFKLSEIVTRINAELLTINVKFVYDSFKKVNLPKNSILNQPGLTEFDSISSDCYPFNIDDFEFLLIANRGLRVAPLAKLTAVELKDKVQMFFKLRQRTKWRKLWPLPRNNF